MPSFPAAAIGLALVAGLAGCTVGPDYVPPDLALKASFASGDADAAKAAEPDSPWWSAFRDPILNGLVETGLAENLDIGQAVARVATARANAGVKDAAGLPQVDGSGSHTRSGGPGNTTGVTESSSATASGSWVLDLFGKARRTREQGRASIGAAFEDVNAARLALIGEVATDYVTARGYQARLAIARRTLASEKETLSLTKAKFEDGAGSGLDVAQVEGEVASTAAEIPTLEASYREAVFALGVLLGEAPESLLALMNKPAAVPRPAIAVGIGIPADLVRNRPDIRKAERELAGAVAAIGIAQADLYPSLTLSGSISVATSNLVHTALGSWSFGPVLDLPIFDGGERRFTLASKRATAQETLLSYKETVLTAMKEVETAASAYAREHRRRADLARSVEAWRRATDLSRDLYRNGSESLLDLLIRGAVALHERGFPRPEQCRAGHRLHRTEQGRRRRVGGVRGERIPQGLLVRGGHDTRRARVPGALHRCERGHSAGGSARQAAGRNDPSASGIRSPKGHQRRSGSCSIVDCWRSEWLPFSAPRPWRRTTTPSAAAHRSTRRSEFDMDAAGTTDELRMAYWNTLSAEQQADVTTRCKDESDTKPRTEAELKFCQVVVK